MRRLLLLLVLSTALWACNKQKPVEGEVFFLNTVVIGSQSLSFYTPLSNEGLPLEEPLVLTFDQPVRPATVPAGVRLSAAGTPVPFSYTVQGAVVTLNTAPLVPRTAYVLSVSAALLSEGGAGCTPQEITFTTRSADLRVVQAAAGGQNLLASPPPRDVPLTFEARLRFSQPLQRATVSSVSVRLFRSGGFEDVQWTFDNGDSTLVLTTARPLAHFEKYTLVLTNAISGPPGYQLTGFNRSFYTALDPMPKFPVLSDADLIETVQRQTFKYFWDFGHPVSGLARERNTSGDIVTTGGSGFALGKNRKGVLFDRKKKRMALIGANGLLVMVPAAIFLNGKAAVGEFDAAFYAVQSFELIVGIVQVCLMGMNFRDGLKLAGKLLPRAN
jgi:hypothetical protein